jgi:hypothetical protein
VSEPAPAGVAVTLSLAPSLEERMIDWLLERDDIATFTGHMTYAHGADGRELSVAEQVSGRQRRLELRVEVRAAAVDAWLGALAAAFAGADVDYHVTPILRSGRLGDAASLPAQTAATQVK